jgi:hypothetical protein
MQRTDRASQLRNTFPILLIYRYGISRYRTYKPDADILETEVWEERFLINNESAAFPRNIYLRANFLCISVISALMSRPKVNSNALQQNKDMHQCTGAVNYISYKAGNLH